MKKAMLSVDDALKAQGLNARLLLQVHDELLLECADDEATLTKTLETVKDCMENAVTLDVPLRVTIEHGKNWGQFH